MGGLYFARLFVTLHKLLTLENKNKGGFILYFARLFVTLHRYIKKDGEIEKN